jgi:hypothetical protein
MAQIIKHRRGSLESLSSVTGSLQKGEIVIASGSSNLSVTNGSSLVFAVPENGQVQATNRFLIGNSAPNTFAGSTYNGMVKGVPYYASGSSTLYLLGTDGNDAINLVGNIQPFSSSVASAIGALSSSLGGGGAIGTRVANLESLTGSYATTGSNTFVGNQDLGSNSLILNGGAVQNDGNGIELYSNDFAQLTYDNYSYIWVDNGGVHFEVDGTTLRFDYDGGLQLPSYTLPNAAGDENQVLVNDGNGNLSWTYLADSASVATQFSASAASVSQLSASVASVTGDFSSSVATSFSASAASQTQLSASVATSFSASAASQTQLSSSIATSQQTQDGRLNSIESFSGSVKTQLTQIGVVSGSLIASASDAAIAIADLEAIGLTYATTGSNIFKGNQVITGSMYITNDLVVYGSSSLFNVTASALDIGQNTVVLNTATPAVRFGGISVADSGSNQGASGSLFWDSLNNAWIYQHPSASGEGYNSARLISGPQNSGSLGDEAGLTVGKIALAVGDDHIGDSIIEQSTDNTTISIAGDLIVTGSVTADTFVGSIEATNGVVSGSSQITLSDTTGYDTFSGSVSASFAAVIANVGSGVGVSITNLNAFSASTLTRLGNLEATGSDHENRINTAEGDISTINDTLSDIDTAQNEQDARLSSLESFSGSIKTQNTALATVTGSLISSASAAKSTNDSQDGRLDSLETFSGSVKTQLTQIGVVSGSLIASASAAKSTNDSQDVSITNLNSFSSSVLTQLTQIGVVSGSLISSASAAKSTNDTQDGRLDNLESKSASVDIAIAALNSYTSSNTSTNALNAFTASAATKFTEIGVVSGSLIASASNADSRLTTLEGTGNIQGVGTSDDVTFATVTTTGDVVIGGDLVVQGNTVTLNTSTLVVEDKLITLASGSTSNATADGAGFEVAGTSASFKYDGTTNQFSSSVDIVANTTGSVNLGSAAGNSKRIAFRNTNGNLDLVPTASVAGDLLQWNGTDFVMSNTIDGGSF